MGRKKKEETAVVERKTKAKKTASKLKGEDIKTLSEIEKNLLKKCKKDGFINQNEIYDALHDYELDDDAIDELIAFFADNGIEVINEDEDEEEEEVEEEFDESKLKMGEEDDVDDFFEGEDTEDEDVEDLDIEHLDLTLGG